MMYAPEAANDGYEAFCRTFEAIREKAQERAQQVEEALSEVLPSEEESA
jgi:rubrerythrin